MSKFSADTIQHHPYVEESKLGVPEYLVDSGGGLPAVTQFARQLLRRHTEDPIDVIVGEDVSGRVPTLIAHRFLRLARLGGHVEDTPQTLFMASGRFVNDEADRAWRSNLRDQAGHITARLAVNRVMVITEIIGTGRSVGRIEDAFIDNGVPSVDHFSLETNGLYIGSRLIVSEDRLSVGVEKEGPRPVSFKAPGWESTKVSQLRRFLDDYSDAIYDAVFDEPAPVAG